MMSLVLFRLLQGLGAGAIQPVTTTIIGDLFKLEERGRVQGFMATVWATSAVVGPLAGGIIVDNISGLDLLDQPADRHHFDHCLHDLPEGGRGAQAGKD